jgi:uncharacterized protein with von Willebrand factor type A (vWA) domain
VNAERMAVAFARVLRGAGLKVPTGSVLNFVDALGLVGIDHGDAVYWSGRSTLVRNPEDIVVYDRAFEVFWADHQSSRTFTPDQPVMVTLAVDTDEESDDGADDDSTERDTNPQITLRFSAAEVLRHKDFGEYTAEELSEAQRLMSQLRFVGPPRHSFRQRPAANGRAHDLRRTLRASLRTGGEPIERHWREPGERLRRLVLILDVSGSMEPYARAMLRFVHAAVSGRQRVEAFAIGTRLTRVTRELNSRDPDKALAAASERVHDWSGGTRLGECMRTFNDQWGVRGLARGAIVVILSDGWDRGDPEVLGEQMQRLHRVAFHSIWVNPLKVTPGYAPLARGMAAALPHVDDFVEGHSVAALQHLAAVIASQPGDGRMKAHTARRSA